jgi:hypothetical protein
MLAHTWARAVSSMLTRKGAFARETCCQRAGRGAEEPAASLDTHGVHLHQALDTAACLASVHAKTPRGHDTLRPASLMGPPLSLLFDAALVAHGPRVRLLPRTCRALDNACALSPLLDEDGRRARRHCSVAARAPTRLCPRRPGGEGTARRVWCRHVWSALSYGNHGRTRDRLLTTSGIYRRKKHKKSALRSSVSLDTRGPHTCSARSLAYPTACTTTGCGWIIANSLASDCCA